MCGIVIICNGGRNLSSAPDTFLNLKVPYLQTFQKVCLPMNYYFEAVKEEFSLHRMHFSVYKLHTLTFWSIYFN